MLKQEVVMHPADCVECARFWKIYTVRAIQRWLLLVLLGAVSVSAQPPEHRDDKYKDDPHAFCWTQPDRGSAHQCSCVMVCGPDTEGNIIQQETASCQLYCSKDRCTCHAEEPCPGPPLL
jgi:hypothetical protein